MLHLQTQLDQAKANILAQILLIYLKRLEDNYCFGHDIWWSVIVEINWLLLLALHFVQLLFLNIFLKNCQFFYFFFCETVNLVFALHYCSTYFCKIVNLTSSRFAIFWEYCEHKCYYRWISERWSVFIHNRGEERATQLCWKQCGYWGSWQ